jgi:YVTN family beta-propeller protein
MMQRKVERKSGATTPLPSRGSIARLAILTVGGFLFGAAHAGAIEPTMQLEAKIPLGEVRGRIDHLAFDAGRDRLFVAELGNDSVGVLDLKARKVIHRIAGLKEPQGVGYAAATDTIYVANAGDGSVRLFTGSEFKPEGRIDLGSDADNVRIDAKAKQAFVGYGSGALAEIDLATKTKRGDIALPAHPESFQLQQGGKRIFVNLPDAHLIAVADRANGKVQARWPTRGLAGNFPMALDENSARVVSVFRSPARLAFYAMEDGKRVAERETCGDADDVFVDRVRMRIYVICGEGAIDVFDASSDAYKHLERLKTVPGARTGLMIPERDLLAVALRASRNGPAAIWLYRLPR